MKKTITTADLATKTCKRGHTGEYQLRKDGSSACKACSRNSLARHRGVEEAKMDKLRENSLERVAELEGLISRLKVQLQLAETEHEFVSKRLAILEATK